MAGGQLGAGFGDAFAAVLFLVPGRGAHLGEEVLHRSHVACEQLAVQVARVPVNEDPAQVEQHGLR